jgi:hypothetical protein
MSESFSSLLGQLQESISKGTAAISATKTTKTGKEESKVCSNQTSGQKVSLSRKRPRVDNRSDYRTADNRTQTTSSTTKRIHDLQELSVHISFLVIGAQKAGTSWLHTMLSYHPQLNLPSRKELHFWDWNRAKGLKWYSDQFTKSKSETSSSSSSNLLLGEITPCYAVLKEHHIQEIRTLFPTVKIIFVARDIVDRAWSALCMELRNAVRGVPAGTFAEGDFSMAGNSAAAEKEGTKSSNNNTNRKATDDEEAANPDNYDDEYFVRRLQHSTHYTRSDYATSIRNWLRVFPKEQLLLLNYRDIQENPRKFLTTICDHIGVDSEPLLSIVSDAELQMKINPSSTDHKNKSIHPRPSLHRNMRQYLQPMQDEFNTLLEELGYQWRLGDNTEQSK